MKRSEQFDGLREQWDGSSKEVKSDLVWLTALSVVVGATDEIAAGFVFDLAREDGISAPNISLAEFTYDPDEELVDRYDESALDW